MTVPTKITAESPEARSADLIAANVAHLKSLFPEAFTEGKIDFEALKQLLGGSVDEREEKYGLTWHGKRQARQLALTPSLGTLRPCPEESVDWDTTQNLMIEGDNLEVLKLLQKSYAGKVKMIYIDPPYNTGHDFVYLDDYQDNIKNYLELTRQISDGVGQFTPNVETSGRFHTQWLNMMYPRLKIVRTLLSPDGVIFASIDDREASNMIALFREIFEEDNVECMIWEKVDDGDAGAGRMKAVTRFRIDHEYIICAYKSNQVSFKKKMEIPDFKNEYGNPDNDPRGPYKAGNMSKTEDKSLRSGKNFYTVTSPGGRVFERQWHFDIIEFEALNKDGRIYWGKDNNAVPSIKIFINEPRELVNSSLLKGLGSATSANKSIRELFDGHSVFNNPKPINLMKRLIEMCTNEGDIILDFFSGSGSTANAVMAQMAQDQIARRFMAIQIPEPITDVDTVTSLTKLGLPKIITEITKERLRRVSKIIHEENPIFAGDLGFRVFKLDSSNIATWEPKRDDLAASIQDSIFHLKEGRQDRDILFEILLKYGLDLAVPMTSRTIAQMIVHSIGGGVLTICLADGITAHRAQDLGQGILTWIAELQVAGDAHLVFKDSGFVDDVAKTNLVAILTQGGIEAANIRTL